jgi:hypothetical protein
MISFQIVLNRLFAKHFTVWGSESAVNSCKVSQCCNEEQQLGLCQGWSMSIFDGPASLPAAQHLVYCHFG